MLSQLLCYCNYNSEIPHVPHQVHIAWLLKIIFSLVIPAVNKTLQLKIKYNGGFDRKIKDKG